VVGANLGQCLGYPDHVREHADESCQRDLQRIFDRTYRNNLPALLERVMEHIKIGNVTPRIQFVGNGISQHFVYPFAIFREADLEVFLNDVKQSSGFSVSGAGSSAGGTVTFSAPPGVGVIVTLRRSLAIQRTADFQESGDFRAATLNDEFDYQTAALQNLAADIATAVRVPPTDQAANLILPKKAERAGKILGFDHDGAVEARTLFQGGASDHNQLSGLQADDHPQYLTSARAQAWLGTRTTDSLAEGVTNKYMRLAGTGTNTTAARTDHQHAGVYEPAFPKNTAFNKNFGTGSGDVAAGNHSHAISLNTFAVGDLGNVSEAGRAEGYALTWSVAAAQWEPRPQASGGGSGRFGLRNLIANATFRINQRQNFATTLAAGVYCYDRWRAGASGCTYSLLGTAMTITAGSIAQTINGASIAEAGPYSLSWEGTASATVNGAPVTNGGQVMLTPAANVVVAFAGGTLAKPQLEQNPTPTPFEQRPIELEMQLCLPYYQKSYPMTSAPGTLIWTGSHLSVAWGPADLTQGVVVFTAPMQSPPTFNVFSPVSGLSGRAFDVNAAADRLMLGLGYEKSAFVQPSSATLVAGHRIQFHWTADAEF
jgi:hypothetical protein